MGISVSLCLFWIQPSHEMFSLYMIQQIWRGEKVSIEIVRFILLNLQVSSSEQVDKLCKFDKGWGGGPINIISDLHVYCIHKTNVYVVCCCKFQYAKQTSSYYTQDLNNSC